MIGKSNLHYKIIEKTGSPRENENQIRANRHAELVSVPSLLMRSRNKFGMTKREIGMIGKNILHYKIIEKLCSAHEIMVSKIQWIENNRNYIQ